MADYTIVLSAATAPFTFAALISAAYVSATITFDPETPSPLLKTPDGKELTEAEEIVATLGAHITQGDSTKQATFVALAKNLVHVTAYPEVVSALDLLDYHLAYRTFLVGHTITSADFAVWGALKSNAQVLGVLKRNQHVHLQRWYTYIETIPSTHHALASLAEARAQKLRTNKTAASFTLGLPEAVEGKVVTRFPPEPSGYLHIGHTKAAILNQYFASMYKGQLIIRFDDTNPSKEKEEYETTILQDLELLEIRGDRLTHTSDYFQELHDYCVEIIKHGKAYADDTEQMEMRQMRMDGIASRRRDESVEDNLARFALMTSGDPAGQGWCIRAKISVDDGNKAMRDPVIYRANALPHHRTGDKWKVYPTYDFACPIVDAMEGVTHALRTNEYRDRNPQYQWMLDALSLRKVHVWDYSRVSFVYTLLSKRKLLWFVEKELVQGWDDPRFPTVRGIRRRGMTIEALKQYMLSQGPSQATVLLEWDGIWATNKKVIDPIAPRYWAVETEGVVKVTIEGQAEIESKSLPLHKKNPELGEKTTVYGPVIYVDQEDAKSFDDQEEITLMDWGNAIVTSKSVAASGSIEAITMKLHIEGDFKKTKKKITWLAESTPTNTLTPITLIDYDYLITKKKLEETDSVQDFVTPQTEFKTACWADANVLQKVKVGDIIQFERKGYYICDRIAEQDRHMDFVKIPDGKMAGLASKAGGVSAVAADGASKEKSSPWGKSAPPKKAGASATSAGASTDAPDSGRKVLSEGVVGFEIPITSQMYDVKRVYGEGEVIAKADTKMYEAPSVYKA